MVGAPANAPLDLTVGRIAAGGACVARAPDGRVVFVRHALPGERVRARVTAATTAYLRADAVEVLDPSPDRVPAPCAHAGPGRCGGCDFQHVSLGAQRGLKAALVAEQLERLAGIDHDVAVEAVPGDRQGLGWRNRVRLAVTPRGAVGFRRHRSHHLELVDACPLASPAVAATGALGTRWSGASQIEVATATPSSAAGGTIDGGAPAGADTGEAIVSVLSRRGRRLDRGRLPDVRAGLVLDGAVLRAPGALHATAAGRTYRVSAGVFWQVHPGAADALVAAVLGLVGACSGAHVVDLYAGAGLLSVPLAVAAGPDGSVLAVERDPLACADARHNGTGVGTLRVRRATVTPELVAAAIGRPDVVVLDPSRRGAGTAVMAALAGLSPAPRRVVSVSCDPASFARDARVLLDHGWTLQALRAFDIFPMTEHVELVAAFDAPQQA